MKNKLKIGIIRYLLGLIMIAYGLIKIFDFQFTLPEEAYNLRLNELEGVTLTWAFLGYSPWFSKLLGFFEFVPGILLLFRSTKYLGAILLFPTLLVIFLINNAYGFLLHMRIFTGVLILMDLVILFSIRRMIYKFFSDTFKANTNRFESTLNVVLVLVIILTIYLLTLEKSN